MIREKVYADTENICYETTHDDEEIQLHLRGMVWNKITMEIITIINFANYIYGDLND